MDIKKKNLENRSVQKSLQLLTEEKDRLRQCIKGSNRENKMGLSKMIYMYVQDSVKFG